MIKKNNFIWQNGNLLTWDEAKTHVLCQGLNFSRSVFEGIRIYNSHPFYSTEHINRLFKSAEILGFKIPFAPSKIENAILTLIENEQIESGYVRPVAWVSSETPALYNKNEEISLAIIALSLEHPFSNEQRSFGISLKTSTYIKPAYNMNLSQSKTGAHYMISCNAMHEAKALGYEDTLILDSRGFITEASGANIFIVKDQILYTPIADCFLNGITRQIIIKLAKENSIRCIEKHITLNELLKADEIFLTGTAYEIVPIKKIDQQNFRPGKIINLLKNLFADLIIEKCPVRLKL